MDVTTYTTPNQSENMLVNRTSNRICTSTYISNLNPMFYTKAQKHAAMCIALFWYRYDLYGYQDFTGNVRIVLMKNVWL